MKRPLALSVLALAATIAGAACSGKVSVVGFDPGMCARASACLWSPNEGFGYSCELLADLLHDVTLGWLSTDNAVLVAMLQCQVNAADCAAMKACTQATPAEAALCGPTTIKACSGDDLIQCPSPEYPETHTPVVTHCAAGGAHCFAFADTAACGTAACDPTTTQPSCDGDVLVQCLEGAVRSGDCAYAGPLSNTCAVVAGTAQCAGSGAPCDETTTPPTCDGTVLVSCTGGRTARFDCAKFSGGEQTCNPNGTCSDVATACSSSTAESCDGSVLTYCWHGTVATFDCKAYGLSGCATTTQNGSTFATCTQ
jgi:hypothetical protein